MTPESQWRAEQTRRQFFGRSAVGIGGAALASLLNGSGFAADAGWGYGFNIGDRLVDVTGNGCFRACPAKEAAITPCFLIHTASPSATESAKEFL